MKIWIDGQVVAAGEARVSVLDHGFLYGDGVFEGIRCYSGRVFRLEDHLRRLATGARVLALELPGGIDAMRRIVLESARANGSPDAYLRLVVSRGEGELGVDPTTCPAPRVVCIAADVKLYPAEKLAEGLALATSSLRRPGADVLDPRVKSLNYLNNALAKLEARQRGADEALLLNASGHVAEASAANVFAIRDGRLATPPATDGALAGITRMTVLELARELGLEAAERTLGRFDLFDAEEVFLTGTGARIVPVASLDGRPIGAGRGPGALTKRLTEAFDALARSTGTPFQA
jgi:branched-chain amino acid aminotransferase